MENDNAGPEWFVVRSQHKRQNFAAVHLRNLGVEVFNPQLRIRRSSRQGPVWRTEPLFLNYLFVRFDMQHQFRMVRYAAGVSKVVNFGGKWGILPAPEVAALQSQWPENEEPLQITDAPEPGDTVRISGGIFHGMEATVVALLPARERVKVLLEFLGGIHETEVGANSVMPVGRHPFTR
jgi:transcriptional antiterminator RfaH